METALRLVGLADRMDHYPGQLSGGEQQRVAIARAVVAVPTILVADEPTGDLDSHTAGEIMALLRRLHRDNGQTFVIVTHDPNIGALCDRVITIRDGLCEDCNRQRVELAPVLSAN